MTAVEHPRFFYDLRSPTAWLAAERIVELAGEVPEFVPVELSALAAQDTDADLEDIAARAVAYGLLPVRPPAVFPPTDTRFAMLAATYAKQIGKVVAYSMAGFRQTFAGGRDLADRETVFLAGAAAEIHPAALIKGAELKGTARRLQEANAEAAQLGVLDVPALVAADGSVRYDLA